MVRINKNKIYLSGYTIPNFGTQSADDLQFSI